MDINNLKSILHFIRFGWWTVLILIYIFYTANTTFSWYTHILLLRCDIHSVKYDQLLTIAREYVDEARHLPREVGQTRSAAQEKGIDKKRKC